MAGQYVGSLDNLGETLTLHDGVGEVIEEFRYSRSWYPITDGPGFSLVASDTSLPPAAWSSPSSWQPSRTQGGSPGVADLPPLPSPRVVVSEILSNPLGVDGDAIEIQNLSAATADVSGWYLTDDFLTPMKYRLPAGSVIPPGGFLVFREAAFNPKPSVPGAFALSASGESAYLFAADAAGNLTGYVHGTPFGASAPGIPFARVVTSQGLERFVPALFTTLGSSNTAPPAIGPVVISEIHYHPAPAAPGVPSLNRQFVELANLQGTLPLYDPGAPTNTWRLRGDVDFDFPTNVVLQPGEVVVVVGFDPVAEANSGAALQAEFGIPPSTRLFGPFRGSLGNGGGSLHVSRPNPPGLAGVDYVVLDSVTYDDVDPWPTLTDGDGASLQRRRPVGLGDDPGSWSAAVPTPGVIPAQVPPPVIQSQPMAASVVAGSPVGFSLSVAGTGEYHYQWLLNGAPIPGAIQRDLQIPRALPADAGQYRVVVLGAGGVTLSDAAPLDVALPPFFVTQPQSRFVLANTNITLSGPVVGTGGVTYQWWKDGVALTGQNGPSLALVKVQPSDSGVYVLVATDSIGTIRSDSARVVVSIKPAFVFPAQPVTVVEGETVVLFAAVSGTTPLSFKWTRSGKVITNYDTLELTGSLVLPNIQTTQAGSYSLSVSNFGGSISLNPPAIVTVLADADRDGMADAWELAHGFDPAKGDDALADADGDGVSNRDESVAGTDPRDPASYLGLSILPLNPGVLLQWNAASNHSYTLLYRTNLLSAPWVKLADVPVKPADRPVSVPDPAGTLDPRFYRLVVPARP
ncbi:MAG TPA: hypothetical protein DCM86_15940 [Verrucomicrobiales bacterium]|nr:hypothetical protein [Verrucomicrobiales bacterium]